MLESGLHPDPELLVESDVVHEQLVMPHAVVRMMVAGLGVIALPVMIFAALASKIFQRRDVDAYRHA